MKAKLYVMGRVALFWVAGMSIAAAIDSPTKAGESVPAINSTHGDPNAGRAKSELCIACHTVDGNSTVPAWPKIAGQLEKYLVKVLLEYQKGEKGPHFDPTMASITQALTERDIANLAAYFAQQKGAPGATASSELALGQKIYRGGHLEKGIPACIACHGAQGQGNAPANFPRLSGQHPDYTIVQLKKFRAGTRSGDPNGIMRDIVNKMTDKEIQAVSSYVSGLH